MKRIPQRHLDHVESLSADDFAFLARAVRERECREEHGFGTLAEASALFRPDPACPVCGSREGRARDGRTDAGLPRYRCGPCGARFTALSGTVLDGCRKDMTTWALFIRLMCWNAPLDEAAELCGLSHKTAFEWRHRVLAAVDGWQDRTVLSGTVWIDETYVSDPEVSRDPGAARRRGLSKDLLCIAVGIDSGKRMVAKVCGNGKPTVKRLKDSMLRHLARGSVVYHDKERAHRGLLKAAGCVDVAIKADCKDPSYLESMELVNDLCAWLKRYLRRFPGMKKDNLQSYLNWFVYLFQVKRADEKWPKVGRVVRHLLMADADYRSS